uniref:Uncharacterized protein n=1 Tax=Arundo donax TaxID=35708 RepID=A0A0A9HHV8_ARUDO
MTCAVAAEVPRPLLLVVTSCQHTNKHFVIAQGATQSREGGIAHVNISRELLAGSWMVLLCATTMLSQLYGDREESRMLMTQNFCNPSTVHKQVLVLVTQL